MKRVYVFIFLIVLLVVFFIVLIYINKDNNNLINMKEKIIRIIDLPDPQLESAVSIEEALLKRRSVREFLDKELSILQISQILWSAYGLTDKEKGFKTAPSAGAIYPLDIYLVINQESDDLSQGVYKYDSQNHKLGQISNKLIRKELTDLALGQDSLRQAPIVLVITGDYQKTINRYGERAHRYVHMEAGHVSQNVYLQAVSLNLGTVVIGAFDDQSVNSLLGLPKNITTLYLMPIGLIF
jgi:SagB-type dehydrogenase family enzyme